MEDTFAIIKPDAWGKPWIENLLEKNDEEEEPPAEENDEDEPRPPREQWKTVSHVRAPDMGVEIIKRIERAGFEIVKRKTMLLTPKDAAEFYAEHDGKPFYAGLVKQMTSDPVCVLVLRRENAIKEWRNLMGATNPDAARAAAQAEHPLDDTDWSLRALFGVGGPKNATHGSDSPFSAMREISLMFPPTEHVYERAFAVVTLDAVARVDNIISTLEADNFVVVARSAPTAVSGDAAKAAAASDASLGPALARGSSVGLVVEGFNAVLRLKLRVGPAVSVAKANIPSSLRALFGTDDAQPGVTAVDAAALSGWFKGPLPLERTLAVIKPGVAAVHGDAISAEIRRAGFMVLAEDRVTLSRQQAAALYQEHADKPFFETLVKYMTSGDVIALALEKPGAIRSLQVLLGPTSPEDAAREAKHTLRGRYGTTKLANAVHGSADTASANREICSFFPSLHPTPMLTGDAAVTYLKDAEVAVVDSPMGPIPKTLHATLVEGLTALCKAKPAGLDAVRYLGEWLIKNNPRAASAAAAGSDDSAGEYKSSESSAAAVSTRLPVAVFVPANDDATTALCKRLGAQFGYAVVKSTEGSDASPAAVVSSLKEAMAREGGRKFIVQNFPPSLDHAFYFEKAVAQPLFVLVNQKVDGPVADLYAKVGAARIVKGTGDAAFTSAAVNFYPKVVFALGLPGSGRSSVCAAVEATYGYKSLNLDDLVKAESRSGSVFGRSIADAVAKGDQLPMESVIRLFKDAMDAEPTGSYVIDGYPRTLEQAQAFAANIAAPRFVLLLDCPEDECLRRYGPAAKKGIRVFKGRTQKYIDLMRTLGLVRSVDASRPLASVIADTRRHFDPDICFVLGGPGSGKGTQCERLVAQHQFAHLSAGDLLRAELARGSPQGASIKILMEKGLLVPVDVTLTLLKAAMKTSGGDRFLVDGFPRAMDQAAVFEEAVCHPTKVLFLDVPDDEMTKRLLHRGLTSGRGDDNAETIKHRLKTFHNQSVPVIDRYSAEGKVALIDGTGSVAQVTAATDSAFRTQLVVLSGGVNSGVAKYGAQLAEQFGYVFLSAPALVDAEIQLGTPAGRRLESLVKEDAVSATEIADLLQAAMVRSRKQKFIFEGFPRSVPELQAFEAKLGFNVQLWAQLDHPKDSRTPDLQQVCELFESKGALVTVNAAGAAPDVYGQLKLPFQPQVTLLVGSAGSGRGEFARRAGKTLGYARLRVTHLLRAEAATGSALGTTIATALEAKRTVPVAATLAVIRNAIARSPAKRFLIDGYPRIVSDGYPSVQDQVFAFEDAVGPIKSVVVLEAAPDLRAQRVLSGGSGVLTPGQQKQLAASTEAFTREKLKILGFFDKLGKVVKVDTSANPDAVFAAAKASLQ